MRVPLFKIFSDEADIQAVTDVIKEGMYWTAGSRSAKFETMISEYLGTKYAVVLNSGTSALHAAIMANNIKKGDEAIVPSFSFISTANSVLFAGAKPVFADIEPKTFGLDPESVKEKITTKTKAIIPVHYGGSPCLIRELKEIADDYDLVLIEDAAESFGAKIENKCVGTFGESGMLSFCQNKIITTGDGGAIITDSKEIYSKIKLIRSHGRPENTDYFTSRELPDYVCLGYNYRMSEITAALGIAQLKKAGQIIEMRRKKAEYLTEQLRNIEEITLPLKLKGYFYVYQMYPIRVNRKYRDALMKHLAEKNVATKVYFPPIHLTYFYKNELKYNCKLPVTEQISSEIFTLPIYSTITTEELEYVINEIKNFFA
jgi:perosamine synthetase